jgi:hypothetical protein
MALHPGGCGCDSCQNEPIAESVDRLADTIEAGFGYQAFEECESFPTPEHWNRGPMKAPRWGMSTPWSGDSEGCLGGPIEALTQRPVRLGGDFNYDPSDFGRSMQLTHLGQAFVPGTVNTDIPGTAWAATKTRQIFTAPGVPSNPSDALAYLTSQGQGPNADGISPTLTLKQAQAQANDQDMELLADGTLTPLAQASGIPKSWIIGGILAYLILK